MLVYWIFLLTNYNVYEAITETAECREYVQPQSLIVGSGTPAQPKLFPFMAALGYENNTNIVWLCGGALVSDKFVLTAAHCLYSLAFGNVQLVHLGVLDLNNYRSSHRRGFLVVEVYSYPEYKRGMHYHDIALLKLDDTVRYNDYIQPVCLHFNHTLTSGSKMWAPGWGDLNYWGDKTTHLMKVELKLISYANCSEKYRHYAGRRLMSGIMDDIQVCAGNTEGQDTCPGDSGGPLIIQSTNRIIGITSFGKACGIGNTLGVYTRVSYYVPWIDSIVQNTTEALSQNLTELLIFQ